ncbi:MAG: Ppx/GppA phosphatase family protein, partial [Pseudomonadota bacterium]
MPADTVEQRRRRRHARQGSLFPGQARSFQSPRPGDDRIGVLDIGSNSVRFVVFEGGRRCPAMVFNEKILCGLGARLGQTGKLDPAGCARALRALQRFVALAPGLRVGAMAAIATAAVREAEDGPAFRDRIRKDTGIRPVIASGADEARLAAQGVLFGDPFSEGMVVDLGGASMELCPVARGRTGVGVTTPLGPQRLGPLTGDRDKVRSRIRAVLRAERNRYPAAIPRLYLVGGAWRALARVEIALSDHPLPVLHEHTFTVERARRVCDHVLSQTFRDGADVPGLPSGRVTSLPHAALLLEGLLDRFEPEHGVAVSGFGLREGVCYEHLPEPVRAEDPLISTCAGQELTRARAPGFGAELSDWLLTALKSTSEREERLVRAACLLADVSWRAHPDFRARSCMEVVTRVNVSGAGHAGRAFIAACLLARYKGGRKATAAEPAMSLLSPAEVERASQVGALIRLGASIAGA